jgi:hypothetical protein
MVNLQNKPIIIGTPIEIEKATNQLRLLLANLPWITHPYHIAQKFYRKENSKVFYYPETYCPTVNDKYGYHRLTADNDYKGMFFFLVGQENNDFNANQENFLDYEVAIIFSVNLKLIDNLKLNQGLFTQELIKDVRKLLTNNIANFDFQYTLNTVTRDLKEVYREFTLDDIEQYNRAPIQCFRFNLTLKIQEEC